MSNKKSQVKGGCILKFYLPGQVRGKWVPVSQLPLYEEVTTVLENSGFLKTDQKPENTLMQQAKDIKLR